MSNSWENKFFSEETKRHLKALDSFKLGWIKKGYSFGFRWPFTEEDVNRQRRILASIKYREPEPKELTGSEFILFCNEYNERKK